jgi:lipoate-protein ligase A
MLLLDLTLNSPAENLALDEALLDWAEESTPKADRGGPRAERETLRLWEPAAPFVVLGRGSRIEEEVDLAACRRLGVPVLRRASGGAAVVVGPGCLMYAVILSYNVRPELRMLDVAHRFVLGRVAEAASECFDHVAPAGTSDLAIPVEQAASLLATSANSPDGAADSISGPIHSSAKQADFRTEAGSFGYGLRKFSGNSLRCKRTHFLYHGTLMYEFDIGLIEKCLRMPPRQPEYRERRSHAAFLANLPTASADLRVSLVRAWQATTPLDTWPQQHTATLAKTRYQSDDWTWRQYGGPPPSGRGGNPSGALVST